MHEATPLAEPITGKRRCIASARVLDDDNLDPKSVKMRKTYHEELERARDAGDNGQPHLSNDEEDSTPSLPQKVSHLRVEGSDEENPTASSRSLGPAATTNEDEIVIIDKNEADIEELCCLQRTWTSPIYAFYHADPDINFVVLPEAAGVLCEDISTQQIESLRKIFAVMQCNAGAKIL
ncbi:hypothetical protein H0H92_013047 [Tricholoma furcatifolium]|nr:hypothetical protein H0H92_013047 [Tricholoma furcatifolium]